MIFAILFALHGYGATPASAERRHALAMHGEPALSPGFEHLPYVNPNAPKGGRLTLGVRDTFDSLNPFIPKGKVPTGIRAYVFESLLARSADEPFTLYGLVAQSIDVAADRSWITFHINPAARFADGHPITAEDVVFSHEILKTKGRPYLRSHYGKVARTETPTPRTVTFHFNAPGDREIPLIIALMPILPKHAIDPETFAKTSLRPPLGSGPYTIVDIKPGRSMTFARNADYWARDLPVRRGLFNFDEVRLVFYLDEASVFRAFTTGEVDARTENNPARWLSGYNFPAINEGRATKLTFKTGRPAGMTGLVFNTRRKKFADKRVRKALMYAFNSDAINKKLFHGRYERSTSFYSRSYLASTGKPASAAERALLQPFMDRIEPSILDGTWRPPESGQDPRNRRNLRKAFKLLNEAGYMRQGTTLVDGKTGEPFKFEFLTGSDAQTRLALQFKTTLSRLGITLAPRQMESSQMTARLGAFDFDMVLWTYSASLSPGNEQINRWASSHATVPLSLNLAGAKNPAVDAMIKALLAAVTREDFISAVRAYDRALLSGMYVIPLFHAPEQWYAAYTHLRWPKRTALFGADYATWWHAEAK